MNKWILSILVTASAAVISGCMPMMMSNMASSSGNNGMKCGGMMGAMKCGGMMKGMKCNSGGSGMKCGSGSEDKNTSVVHH